MATVNPVTRTMSEGRRSVVAVAIAALLVLAIAAGITLAAGRSVVEALGIGLFCAAWGGPGFGCMIAGVTYASRSEDASKPGT